MNITERVTYIGVHESHRRMFDLILETDFGTGYNSYIVRGDKTAVIETVPERFSAEYLEKIEAVLPVTELDYVILNHAEPDHAGGLSALLERNPDLEVYATNAGIQNAMEITNQEMRIHSVRDGEILDLGNGVTLEFVIAPDLPWPDTMFTYLEKDKILFSCDVFGTHICEPSVRDQYVKDISMFREERYSCFRKMFAPAKSAMQNALKKIEHKNVYKICPGHGPVLEEYVRETLGYYRAWSLELKLEKYVAVFYASAYGFTEFIAGRLARELRGEGIPVKVFDVTKKDLRSLEKPLNEASGIMIGSPTIHGDAAKPIWDLISYAKTIKLNSKPALVFGSYGWSGEAGKNISNRLRSLQYQVIGEGLTCILKPSTEDKRRIGEAARSFAAAFK